MPKWKCDIHFIFCDDEVEFMCISSGCPDLSDLEKEEQVQVNGPE